MLFTVLCKNYLFSEHFQYLLSFVHQNSEILCILKTTFDRICHTKNSFPFREMTNNHQNVKRAFPINYIIYTFFCMNGKINKTLLIFYLFHILHINAYIRTYYFAVWFYFGLAFVLVNHIRCLIELVLFMCSSFLHFKVNQICPDIQFLIKDLHTKCA